MKDVIFHSVGPRGRVLDMRKQYNFWEGDAWDVDRLVALSARLPVTDVALTSITEIDSPYWFDGSDQLPTVRNIVEHVRLIEVVDLSYPIILSASGRVMDGMHRIARAILEGLPTIKAVRFTTDPEPDYVNCRLADLPYDQSDPV
jgi:hypothetical protein